MPLIGNTGNTLFVVQILVQIRKPLEAGIASELNSARFVHRPAPGMRAMIVLAFATLRMFALYTSRCALPEGLFTVTK
jgi:hypothetical protein